MEHIKEALKKVILERLTLVKGYPYFRYYGERDGDFLTIWIDVSGKYHVARSNLMIATSFKEFNKIPDSGKRTFNPSEKTAAIEYFIEMLESYDG